MSDIVIPNTSNRLKGKYFKSPNPKAPIALVIHTDSAQEGDMGHNVVLNICKTFTSLGITILWINFKGLGKPNDNADESITEMIDASEALNWLQKDNELSELKLITGFSFGSWIAMQLVMRRPEIERFIVVSPPVDKYDFSFLSPCPVSGLIIHGNKDSVVLNEDVVKKFAYSMSSKRKNILVSYEVIENADHFFRGKITNLNHTIINYLTNNFKNHLSQHNDTTTNDQEDQMYL